jgi:GAF domain-containing protein/ActR/RegA family two-component response regulator
MPSPTLFQDNKPTKILYIEDNPENRTLVRAVLEDKGYAVIDAKDGQSGIEAAIREEPALILLDLNLPGVDGYEVVAILKSFPPLATTPVIAVTAYAMKGDRQRALVAGCDGYIPKSIDVDAFPRQVAEFLRGKRERVEQQDEGIYLRELNQRLVYRLLNQVEETQQRVRQTETLLAVSQAAGSTLDLTEILRRTTRELVRALGADTGGAFIASPDGESFVPIAGYHLPKELVEVSLRMSISARDRLIEDVRQLKGPVCSSNSRSDPRFAHPLFRLLSHQSALVFPILVKGEMIGIVGIIWVWDVRRFTPEELRLIEGVVRQAAIAIENAQLLEAERKTRARQAAFAEIVKKLAQETDFDRLFPLISKRACQLIGVDSTIFSLVEGDEIAYSGSYGLDQPPTLPQRRKLSESRAGRVALTKRRHVSPDTTADPHWRDSSVVTKLGYRAILEVPVILRGKVIGVLGALHKTPRFFPREDVDLLMSLASHTAVVLDRTNLWKKMGALLRETQTLLTVSQAVSSTLDLTEMMRRLARMAALSLGADMVGAYLADPDQEALHPIAGYHVPKPRLEKFMEFPIPLRGHRFLEGAWEHQRPVFSSDAEVDPEIDRETFARFPHRSVLFVPMIVKGQPIGGIFAIWWNHRRLFTSDDLHLAEGISRQAALAIDNARLFASQQEEAEISGALLRVAEAIGSRHDLDAILETVVQITPQLLGTARCGLFLLDQTEGVLIPTKSWGLAEELRPAFLALKRSPQISAVVKAIQSQGPVVVEEATRDAMTPHTVATALDSCSVLIIPLLSGGRLMGTMAVDTPGAPNTFTPRQIASASWRRHGSITDRSGPATSRPIHGSTGPPSSASLTGQTSSSPWWSRASRSAGFSSPGGNRSITLPLRNFGWWKGSAARRPSPWRTRACTRTCSARWPSSSRRRRSWSSPRSWRPSASWWPRSSTSSTTR